MLDAGGVLYLNKEDNGYVNEPLIDFVKAHQGQYKFGVISDTKYDLKRILKDDGISHLFELVLTSEETGKEKTDPEIYTEAVEQLAFKPQEVLLIDNTKEFTEAAEKDGLEAILYTGIKKCLAELKTICNNSIICN